MAHQLRFNAWRSGVVLATTIGLLGMTSVAGTAAKREPMPPIPLNGLTAVESARFDQGRQLFEQRFSPRQGLGPAFNARACVACHRKPSIGGHGPGYRSNLRYNQTPNAPEGRLFHGRTIGRSPVETLPENAHLSKRRPPTLLGLGLIEAIPETAILKHADPDDRDGDGIRGRAAMRDGHLLRFGSQAHVRSLLEFVADALKQEMGLTSPVPGFDQEAVSLPLPRLSQIRIPVPNLALETVRRLADFVALLAPPSREMASVGEDVAERGERLFHDLSCAQCHTPSFRTNPAPFARVGDSELVSTSALLGQEVAPYSDFLLHDLGPALDDGIALGVARTSEYRTPPLWGVRHRQNLLLHDGRANNLEQAILFHGGEAARARNQFLSLPADQRRALIMFLKTL